MTLREIPSLRRGAPLWAVMLGVREDASWTVWGGGSGGRFFAGFAGRTALQRRHFIASSSVIDSDGAAALGWYNGHLAWDVGSSGFLFYSTVRGKWVVKDDFLEPQLWTRTLIDSGGNGTEAAYGDTWHEADSLDIDQTSGTVSFACAGVDAEEARIAGDPAPSPLVLSLGGAVWSLTSSASDPCGEYSALAGGASGTLRVGFWSWTAGGAVFCADPGDLTAVVSAADGTRTECPGGSWTVMRGEGGAWVADLSAARYGAGLSATWAPDDDAPADGDAPAVEWNGLRTAPGPDATYIYQPSRFS